jgi:hypothetical protein
MIPNIHVVVSDFYRILPQTQGDWVKLCSLWLIGMAGLAQGGNCWDVLQVVVFVCLAWNELELWLGPTYV